MYWYRVSAIWRIRPIKPKEKCRHVIVLQIYIRELESLSDRVTPEQVHKRSEEGSPPGIP